jgi:REP element-mobilizing transposase RayT
MKTLLKYKVFNYAKSIFGTSENPVPDGFFFADLSSEKKTEQNGDRFSNHYFATLYTRSKANSFGIIRDGCVDLLAMGQIAEYVLSRLPGIRRGVILETWVIMPNHIHLLMSVEQSITSPGKVIRKIKTAVKCWANIYGQDFQWQFSHQLYNIRDADDLRRLNWYIRKNILFWLSDSMNRENRENQLIL